MVKLIKHFGRATDDMTAHVLLIEDEPKVVSSLLQGLAEAGLSAEAARSGEDGVVRMLERRPDVIVLDLNLPGRDGLDILQTLRRHDAQLPILILSARDTLDDRVRGLNTGADDYLVKPFAFPELLARLRALLRRAATEPPTTHRLADLQVDVLARTVMRAGRPIQLTPREFDILALLLDSRGEAVSRQMIANKLWCVQRATPLDNVIDVHIARLRRKVDSNFDVKLIHTIRGLGFMVSDTPEGLA